MILRQQYTAPNFSNCFFTNELKNNIIRETNMHAQK